MVGVIQRKKLIVIMLPSYVWVTLGIIAGVVFVYFLCLKLSDNDWIGRIPPGPKHLPVIGCLLHLVKMGPLNIWLDQMFLTLGPVVKFCICRSNIVIVRNSEVLSECLEMKTVEEITISYVARIFRYLGLNLKKLDEKSCEDLSKQFYNYKISLEDFTNLMSNPENYSKALREHKVNKVLTAITEKQEPVTVGDEVIKDQDYCFELVDKLATFLEKNPLMFLPGFRFLPMYYLDNKKVIKILQELRKTLENVYNRTVLESNSFEFEIFFVIFVWMNISKTTPRRKKPQLAKQIKENEKKYEFSHDMVGVRYFTTSDYVKLMSYDIPSNTLVISWDSE